MNRRRVFAIGCWVLLTIWLGWRAAISGGHSVKARTLDADAPPAPSEHERTRERAVVEFQNRQQAAELTRLEKEQQKRTELGLKQRERLMRLQVTLANTWSNVLSTNWTVYLELRQKAAGSGKKAAPCTICDGQGLMRFCIVCENSGKCIDCNGTGKTGYGEPCPACRGKGRCYLCGGAGQMPCVFCDDGLVYSEGVPPPASLPLPGGKQQPIPSNPGPQPDYVAQAAQSAPSASQERVTESSAQPSAPEAVKIDTSPRTLGLAALILVGILALRKRRQVVERAQDTQKTLPRQTAQLAPAEARTPQEEVASLIAATRPNLMIEEKKHLEAQPVFEGGFEQALAESQTPPEPAPIPLDQCFEIAPERLDSIKTSFSRVSHAPNESVRQKMLADIASQVRSFRTTCDSAQLGGALQLATALEGLISQMADTPSNVTPATLRTAASAILLLENLAKSGQNLNLANRPQFRFLAVDDDALSRNAVSVALKKVTSQPELAENGETALALLEKNPYDVIFLDVEMPGMDGFELCTRIRQTELNRTVPIIFLSTHCDFESRKKSTQCGAQDLIGKPFMASELAVKALILAMRAPLKTSHVIRNLTVGPQPSKTVSPNDGEPITRFGEIVCQQ